MAAPGGDGRPPVGGRPNLPKIGDQGPPGAFGPPSSTAIGAVSPNRGFMTSADATAPSSPTCAWRTASPGAFRSPCRPPRRSRVVSPRGPVQRSFTKAFVAIIDVQEVFPSTARSTRCGAHLQDDGREPPRRCPAAHETRYVGAGSPSSRYLQQRVRGVPPHPVAAP